MPAYCYNIPIAMHKYSIDDMISWALGLFAFAVLFSVTVVETALFTTLLLLLIKKYREHTLSDLPPSLARHPLFVPWMIYLAVCLLTSLTAYHPSKGFGQLNSDFLKYVCLSTLLLAVREKHLENLSAAYTAAAIGSAGIGIWEVAHAIHTGAEKIPRASGMMNAVRYGEIMAIALLFILAKILCSKPEESKQARFFYLFAGIATFVSLAFSQTRGAYLGFAVGMACLLILAPGLRFKALTLAGALAVVGVAAALFNPAINNRFSIMEKAATATSTAPPAVEEAVGIRLQLWKLGWEVFRAHPVLGIGPDNMKPMFKTFRPNLIVGATWGSLHNLYIHQAAERGIIGLAALLTLFMGLFIFALRNLQTAQNTYTLWAACVLPAYYAMNLTEISFQHVHTSFAIFIALATSTSSIAKTTKP